MSRRLPKNSLLYMLLLLVVALGLGLYQAGCLRGLGLGPAGPVVVSPVGTWVLPYFTAPETGLQQGGVDEAVIADINTAQQQVDVASFDYNLPGVNRALLAARQRGVQVRLVLDDGNLDDEEMARLSDELVDAGIPIAWDQRGAFMHNKFVIIDRTVLWVGSWNLSVNDTYKNNNNVLRFAIPELAANYTAEFEEMFVNGLFGPRSPAATPYPVIQLSDGTEIETYFSPEDNPRAALLARLRQAEREIDFMAFSFTDSEMARILLEKARNGVRVRGVFEARNATSESSAYNTLRQAGLDVRLDGNRYTMHHKVVIIDGRIVITGSYNFSASAAESNDENLLIITNPELASRYQAEFEKVYAAGQVQ